MDHMVVSGKSQARNPQYPKPSHAVGNARHHHQPPRLAPSQRLSRLRARCTKSASPQDGHARKAAHHTPYLAIL